MADKTFGPGLEHHERRCNNVQCRIVIYVGTHTLPLSACPVCLMPGVAVT